MERNRTTGNKGIGTIRHYEVAGFGFSECVYPADFAIPRHAHETGRFTLVLEGAFTEVCGRRMREGNAHILNFLAPNHYHSARVPAPGGRCFNLEISTAMQERVRQHSVVLDDSGEFRDEPLIWLAHRLLEEFRAMDAVAPLAMEGLALELLAAASRRPLHDREGTPPRWLRQARELLHEEFTQTLSLNAIAQTVGVHPTHLARAFRQYFRCTVGDYIRRLRIEQAGRELTSSDISLAEIALKAGFSDQSRFSKVFRQQVGMTPREYRKISQPR